MIRRNLRGDPFLFTDLTHLCDYSALKSLRLNTTKRLGTDTGKEVGGYCD